MRPPNELPMRLARSIPNCFIKPVDKQTRMSITAAKFVGEKFSCPANSRISRQSFLRPQSRHADQIDSASQALTEATYSYDPGAIADGLSKLFFSRSSILLTDQRPF